MVCFLSSVGVRAQLLIVGQKIAASMAFLRLSISRPVPA